MHSQRDCGKGFFSVLGDSKHHSQRSWRVGEEGRGGWGKALLGSALLLSHLPDLGLAAVNTQGNNSKKAQRKGKTKRKVGLAVRRNYSQPQRLLHNQGRGHKPSPRKHCHREPSSHSLMSVCSRTEQKKMFSFHCPHGRKQRLKYYDFLFTSCVLAVLSLVVFL